MVLMKPPAIGHAFARVTSVGRGDQTIPAEDSCLDSYANRRHHEGREKLDGSGASFVAHFPDEPVVVWRSSTLRDLVSRVAAFPGKWAALRARWSS